jgi:mono/diheme cytochrome c family protein
MRSLLFVTLLLGAACSKGDKPPAPTSGTPNAKPETGPREQPSEAKQLFMTVCATCHGPDGKGNGPAADSLNPRPRDYTNPEWQASVTDADIKKIILEGGQGVGKSAMMPAQAQLKDKPDVLNELVMMIRGFARKQ